MRDPQPFGSAASTLQACGLCHRNTLHANEVPPATAGLAHALDVRFLVRLLRSMPARLRNFIFFLISREQEEAI
jgi:hypothetical protein